MQELRAEKELGPFFPNTATMLRHNAEKFASRTVYQERRLGKYSGITWEQFYRDVLKIAANLRRFGFEAGDKMVFFSPNRLEMLELEMAVMASGGISVPIFSNFKRATADLLIRHSGARFLAVSGDRQLNQLSPDLSLEHIFIFDEISYPDMPALTCFSKLLIIENDENDACMAFDAPATEICLSMYTSGTTGTPKCVCLSHQNILSQQAALDLIWNIDENDRFLGYLPWHHSFGGIFEKFTALTKGACYSLESGYGKDPKMIFENWKLVRPTVFFSIPKVYQELVKLTLESKEAEELFFHSGLKFIFTAAASLPEKLSLEFEQRGIQVIEGWGLTETSPCCTLTNPGEKRVAGVVGKPIPGVKIRIGEEDEIQVKGPNVMAGYFNNDEANKNIFTEDGWFRTGDIGEITDSGLKLITRKDRIFKLSNGEKVIPTELEKLIEKQCHYVSFVMVTGSGEDYPVAVIFPDRRLLHNPNYQVSPLEGCFCPRNLDELGKCLHGCLNDANCGIGQKFSRIKAAAIIDEELSFENGTLTPSMKMAPGKVEEAFRVHIANLYGADISVDEDVYIIRLK